LKDNNIKTDLASAIKELSACYEEISLLYRLSETLSGLSVEAISDKIVKESIVNVGAQSAALLLLNRNRDELITQSCRGRWNREIKLDKSSFLWKVIEDKSKTCAVVYNHRQEILSLAKLFLVCPLVGKEKTLGVLILADEDGSHEYLSNRLKLLSAIAFQASLAIENALLYLELEEFLTGTINSFVALLESSSKWTAGHAKRVSNYAYIIAKEMGLDSKSLERLKLCALLHDLGKIVTPKHILNKTETLKEQEIFEIQKHPLIAEEVLSNIKSMDDVALGIKYHHDYWDGSSGLFGKKGEQIPLMARILSVADTFDAITSDRPYRAKQNQESAVREIMSNAGKQFDPQVALAFLRCIEKNALEPLG
jgi:putative nucleotidyltransferase with HDIG domain